MKTNYYNTNMQKLLYIAQELHHRGFENLYVIPSISPSGCHWRCCFNNSNKKHDQRVIGSNWLNRLCDIAEQEITHSIIELTDLFEQQHLDFLNLCKDKNPMYIEWYSKTLNILTHGELPYIHSDYRHEKEYWITTNNQKIPIP